MSLAKDTAEVVARHLVMAGRLMDEEPAQALAHARAARALAGRVGAVREANGLVAYVAGEWAEALSELRTARRLTGDPEHLPVMADCERALGRPDRALLVAEDPQAKGLSPAARVELLIVASGARRDQGHADAAVVSLQVGALEGPVRAWTARLRYAYADALLEAGREDDARMWFARAAEVDERGETDADERIMQLDGVVFEDLYDDDASEAGSAETVKEPTAPSAPVLPDEGQSRDPHGAQAPAKAAPEQSLAAAAPAEVQPAEAVAAEAVPEQAPAEAEPETAVEGVRVPGTTGSPFATEFREVPDVEIPALGKAGNTGLGFIAPPADTEQAELGTDAVEPDGPRSRATVVEPDVDELRLFD